MMKNTPNLYDTLIHILGQHTPWLDKRHFYTLAWMIVGLIESKVISLPEPLTHSGNRSAMAPKKKPISCSREP